MKIEDVKSWPIPDCLKSVRQFLGFVGVLLAVYTQFCRYCNSHGGLDGKDVPFVWDPVCLTAFHTYSGLSDVDRTVHLGH